MIRYVLAAALLAVVGLSGTLVLQSGEISTLRAANAALIVGLDGCNARTTNMQEDKQSDDQVDDIPDDDLRRVPDDWLRPPPASGGLY